MQIRVEKLVYGGRGLARTDSGVVFVDRVLPGERVEVEIVSRQKDYAQARLVRVIEPSEHRVSPACPNFESVGCCDWSHIDPPHQTRIKEDILIESLRRLGQQEWTDPAPIIPSPASGYRIRVAFHVASGRPGFVREGTHDIVPIETCASLSPELNSFLGEARLALAAGRYPGTDSIRAVASPTGGDVAAVFLKGREKTPWSHRAVEAQVGGYTFRLRPTSFFQPNRYTLEPLMSRVAALTGRRSLVLDLFCGDGFFSLAIARRADRVVGVDRRSTTNASRNAHRNGIENIRFVKSSALAFLKNSDIRPDAVVIDPPRSGAGKNLMRRVANLGAPRIVYVSCNPATLAADTRVLSTHGYRMTQVELVDQFPNTHHVEALACFRR
jgi:23S rRNA (uracil1939-C5)-methyltransferase